MTKTAALSKAQIKTLRTLIARGGEMNGYAGQPGFYCNSKRPLVTAGMVEHVTQCDGCAEHGYYAEQCVRPLAGQKGGNACYGRIRITEAGRAAIENA
jgi:hypothetical protein